MGTLSYPAVMSLDGYIADTHGDFQWAAPSPEIFALQLDRTSTISVEILGRKTYALMKYWEALPDDGTVSQDELTFARRWCDVDKVVVSSTMTPEETGSGQVRLVPELSLDELARIVDEAPGAVEIFGPTTATPAIRAGMVDDFHFFVVPKVIGGGLRALPDGTEMDLELVAHRVFDNGTVYMRCSRRNKA